jgi:3-hydroxyisobutyrate dehydrogenase
MKPGHFGFVGLGQMGEPMAARVAAGGFDLTVFDIAGSEALAPEGARPAASLAEVVRAADTVFLSLPDGPAVLSVAREIVDTADRRATTVIDLSTIGLEAADAVNGVLGDAGITYIDAPVSGGTAGARAGTISVIWAGSREAFDSHQEVLAAMAKSPFFVGDQPGQGQAVKLLNNFLSAMCMAATSEAVSFGLKHGIEMPVILDVLNASSGRSMATSDKFPKRVVTGSYDAGFKAALMAKDLALYTDSVGAAGTADRLGAALNGLWREFNGAMPGADVTHVFAYVNKEED